MADVEELFGGRPDTYLVTRNCRESKPDVPFSFIVQVEFRSLHAGIPSVLSIRPTLYIKATLLHRINAFNYLKLGGCFSEEANHE